jgi:DGQHR domain-containing protein
VKNVSALRLPAIEVRQTPARKLYSFAVDGKLIPRFAAVARLHRSEDIFLTGYQRPEVLSHIAGIRSYLESADPLLPNAVVVAFDNRVHFEPQGQADRRVHTRTGELIIPVDKRWDDAEKPGWVVDGQQRIAAVREAAVRSFPMCVTAFITDSDVEQRTQFILVNSTKPLPKGLVYELLPATQGALPRHLRSRRLPALLLERLNHDLNSPLRHLISTPTTPEGVVKDNSVLRMLESSLSDGALYYLRDPRTGEARVEEMLDLVKPFWEAARWVFPEAFGIPARRSRLMHGAGIVSMGYVMDAIAERFLPDRVPSVEEFANDLAAIEPACRWTAGEWAFPETRRRWNDIQNTPRDVQLLADYLLTEHRTRGVNGSRRVRLVVS